MKNKVLLIALFVLTFFDVNAQQEKGITGFTSWLNNWTEFRPNKVEYNEPNQILTGNIAVNTLLTKKNAYLLQGKVYVTNNAILTIEPGTIIFGDYDSKAALIITKGAKIIAEGSETDPIVFTSNRTVRKAGDWGGIILLGDAASNRFSNYASVNLDTDPLLTTYGGTNKDSDCGILKYVRIEYAGAKTSSSENFNGLLAAAVGELTVFDNIMISFCAGDSFEFLGGRVNLNKMISFKSSNDDFKFNYGAFCNIENSLAIRASYLTNTSGSKCMNILSYNKKEEVDFNKRHTVINAKNITLVNNSENVKNDIDTGLIKEAVYIGENSTITFKKSVISGFNPAIIIDKNTVINDDNLKKIKLEQMYFNLCNGNIFVEDNSNNQDLENWYGNAAFANVYSKAENNITFIDFMNEKRPDFRLRIGGITASNDD